jgi:hypothetical protein
MEFYKIFRLKRQLNEIFFIVFFGTSVNLFFNFIIYRKLNRIIDKLNKDTNTHDK